MARILERITFKQLLIYIVSALGVLFFVGYGTFEARKLIEGPRLSIASPRDGSAVGGPVIKIRGNIQNAAFFTIDGRQALADDKGDFSQELSPPPGYAIIEIAARDRFGRTTIRDIHVTVLNYCSAHDT